MRPLLLPAVLAVALLFPITTLSQDGTPTMGTSLWKCDFSYVDDLVAEMTDVGLPIAQSMVDEGRILNWGMMTHLFGDEWNVFFFIATPPGASFLDAATGLQGAQQEALGEESNEAFTRHCTEHKDSIYSWQAATTGGQPDGPPTMGLSFWKCNYGYLGGLVDSVVADGLPVAQEMVDGGDLFAWGMMTHSWGDEWNVMFYTATPDESSFLDVTGELQSKQFAAYGEEMSAAFTENCWGHKDNIYTMQVFTTPASE